MIILYLILIGVALFSYIFTKKYKEEFYKDLDKKKHPLKILYPLSMYIYDKTLLISSKNRSSTVDKKLKAVLIKDMIEKEKVIYSIKKIAYTLAVILGFLFIGFCLQLNVVFKDTKIIQLERPSYGEGKTDYQVIVEDEIGTREEIQVSVDEKKYTKSQLYNIFDENYDDVLKIVLNENSSQDQVEGKLNFIYEYMFFDLSWKINDTELIDYSGNINFDEVKEENGVITEIAAVFYLEDIKKEYIIPLRLIPNKGTVNLTTEEKINNYIENYESMYNSKISLPQKMDEKEIEFYEVDENKGLSFLIFGLISALIIFFIYDRDLDKKMKKRESQMLLDYSDIVSKLSLLMSAGLSISKSWERIVFDYERKFNGKNIRYAFEEMKLSLKKMKSGVSEKDVYREFGQRCNLQEYIKLSSLLEQNLVKGTRELKDLLEAEVKEAFNNRKNIARSKGEEAGTKLLFPMIIMLGIVIIIIVIPAFMSMGI